MERLNYEVLKQSGYKGYILEQATEKVLQFGEGNFLRAFVDYWLDLAKIRGGKNRNWKKVAKTPGGAVSKQKFT